MDYGYDKAKEDDLEERRLRHKPQPTPEQQRERDIKALTQIKTIVEKEFQTTMDSCQQKYLQSIIDYCNESLKVLNSETR